MYKNYHQCNKQISLRLNTFLAVKATFLSKSIKVVNKKNRNGPTNVLFAVGIIIEKAPVWELNEDILLVFNELVLFLAFVVIVLVHFLSTLL